tara:strand:- start:437 stop:742 length:306 start_codon:yes stop_codon:yes gene_type:complete
MENRKKNNDERQLDREHRDALEKIEGKNALKLLEDFAFEMSFADAITSVSCGVVLQLMEGIPCQLKEARKRVAQSQVGDCWEEDCTAHSHYCNLTVCEETV